MVAGACCALLCVAHKGISWQQFLVTKYGLFLARDSRQAFCLGLSVMLVYLYGNKMIDFHRNGLFWIFSMQSLFVVVRGTEAGSCCIQQGEICSQESGPCSESLAQGRGLPGASVLLGAGVPVKDALILPSSSSCTRTALLVFAQYVYSFLPT